MPDSTLKMEEMASRIRALRKVRGYSLVQLAELADISPGHLSEVERGLSEVSGVKLGRVAAHLGVSTDYLLSGRADPSSGAAIHIPSGLSDAAKVLELSFEKTLQLLRGKESLVARRARIPEHEWTKDEWIAFYKKVERYLEGA